MLFIKQVKVFAKEVNKGKQTLSRNNLVERAETILPINIFVGGSYITFGDLENT